MALASLGVAGAVFVTLLAMDPSPIEGKEPALPMVEEAPVKVGSVDIADLLPAGREVEATEFADLDGVTPKEILVHSVVAAGAKEEFPLEYVEAFAWVGGEWRVVFDARTYTPPGEDEMILSDSPVVGLSQIVDPLKTVDFHSDGSSELVIGVTPVGASGGSLSLYVLSWDGSKVSTEYAERTTRGGTVKTRTTTVELTTGDYEEDDPLCCPSAERTVVIGGVGSAIGIVSESIEEYGPQTPDEAAQRLLDAWVAQDRRAALEVATEEAVDDLFEFAVAELFGPEQPRLLACNSQGSDFICGSFGNLFMRVDEGVAGYEVTAAGPIEAPCPPGTEICP